MSTKNLFKRTLAGMLSAFMVITSVPATAMVAYAEEAPIVESLETVEESVVSTIEETVIEEETSVTATEVTTEEESSVVEETTTEVETTTEEVALEETAKTFKVIVENENDVATIQIDYADYDADKEYTVDDIQGIMCIDIEQNPEVKDCVIDQVTYKIGSGSYKPLNVGMGFYYIEAEELTGEDITIKVTSREKGAERTVTIDVDPAVSGITYFVDKNAKPDEPNWDQYEDAEPVDGKIEIKVEDQYYLFINSVHNGQAAVYKDGNEVKYVFNSQKFFGYYPIGQITKDTSGISVDVVLRAETTIDVAANAATVTYGSGYFKNVAPRVYFGTDAKMDLKISAVPKPGYSIEKIEAIPLITTGTYDEETYEYSETVEEDTTAAVAFTPDFSTHANWYMLSKDSLRQIMRTQDDEKQFKYRGGMDGNIQIKIKVTTKAAKETVTFPTEDVDVFLASIVDGEPVFEETPVGSAVVDYNTEVYFGVKVKDAKHKTLASVTKASGTATVTKLTSKKGVVYYKAAGIKSDVTIKATTALTKATGGARFVFEPEEGIAGNVKITSVKGATLDRTSGEYKVNKNVAEVVVTLTADAPYVPALGGAEVAPKVAGTAYSYTFSIPAVDINTDNGETVDITSYAITSELKTVRVDADFNPETTELVSIAEGTIGLYAGDTNWYVPFGSSMTVIVKAKDNCKLTAAYVNDKKVAFAKNEITFKVTDLDEDTFRIDSQKLLKTVVESNNAPVTGKGTTYNILKQYNAAVYVQEGADGKLDLTDENVAITAKIGKDDVPYTIREDKINFTTETFDSVAGKTITVTIKDGKKVVSTTKLVVSAKCTSVKVQGEKKVDGVDTIYLETATKKEPVLKITYNPGVNPADMVLKYVDASGRDAELDISDGVLHPAYMDMISQSDFSLKKEIEVRFVDRSQGDKVVATKNFVLTAKGFENAAPTVKAVSSSDTEVVLSIAKPKVSGTTEMACIYNITATQVVAKGKLPVEGMYGADVADPEVVFNNVKPDENGKVTLKLTDLPAGSGKACNYSFTVSGTYVVPSNVNYKPVTVKAATKAPKYETALKLVNKKVKFYADEGEVLVGTAKFSTATTHKEDLKATFFTYVNGEKYSIADNGEIGHIRIDDDYNIYVNVTQYGELTYEIPAGSYYLEIEAAKDPNAEKASTAKTTITILQPIKEITAKYVSSETLAPDYPTLAYRYEPGKVLTIPAPAVSYVGDSEHNIVPAIKKVQWSIEDYTPDCGINIDANTGKITIAKDINFEGSFTLNVKAKAADFEKNSTSTTCVLVILPKVDFEVVIKEASPYDGDPDITHEPDMYEEVKLLTSDTDKRIEVKNPVAGATYTYTSSNSEVIKITSDGHFTFKNDTSASTLGALITITQKKGISTKKSRVYVYYENVED